MQRLNGHMIGELHEGIMRKIGKQIHALRVHNCLISAKRRLGENCFNKVMNILNDADIIPYYMTQT